MVSFMDIIDFAYKNSLNYRNAFFGGLIILGIIVLQELGFISSAPFKLFLITFFNLAGLTFLIVGVLLIGAGLLNIEKIYAYLEELQEEYIS